jgi:GNAT superfamily N-acetyltransferase
MIRPCNRHDFPAMLEIVNDAAQAYRGVIPADCWAEPYMPEEELLREIEAGVRFWGAEHGGRLVAVMGIQHVGDVSLIRHAYVRTADRRQGFGSRLIGAFSCRHRDRPFGHLGRASWAIRFTKAQVPPSPRREDRMLRKYWTSATAVSKHRSC